MKKYTISFNIDIDGEQEIYANSAEEAVEKFKYQSFNDELEREHQARIEQLEYDMKYEPSYDETTGAM